MSKTFSITVKSILGVCTVYMLFSLPATVIYGSVKDEFGNINIASNLVNSLPNNSVWGVCINLLMWASCICSLPVLLSSTSELLEKNCPDAGTAFFVHDKKRLGIRFAQIAILTIIAYLVPFFGEIVNIYILSG